MAMVTVAAEVAAAEMAEEVAYMAGDCAAREVLAREAEGALVQEADAIAY